MTQITTTPTALPGDLGRRVRTRRDALGLSRETVAELTGMSAGYLAYLEQQPEAQPSVATVMRLSSALQTSAEELLGGNVERPQGQAPGAQHPRLEILEEDQCWDLLGSHGVGRIVFDAKDRPLAVPLNYTVQEKDILVRTARTTVVAAIPADSPVSFEIDHIDDAMSEGWSVLVLGTLDPSTPAGTTSTDPAPSVEPWVGPGRDVSRRISFRGISGRRIHAQ